MGFVYEKISDADKKRYDFSAIKAAPVFLQPIVPYAWTIDRERETFFLWVGSGGESQPHIHYFALVARRRDLRATSGNSQGDSGSGDCSIAISPRASGPSGMKSCGR